MVTQDSAQSWMFPEYWDERIIRGLVLWFLVWISQEDFFKNNFGAHECFCGANCTSVLDFRWYLPWVSNPCLHIFSHVQSGFVRFTTTVTPAHILMASMAAEPFLIHILVYVHTVQVLVGLKPEIKCATQCALWPSESMTGCHVNK